MNDLNLLPSEAKFQAERMHLKAMINNFLWIFGGLWLSLVVIVFAVGLIFQLNLNRLNKNYQKGLTQYESLIGSMAVNQKIKYQAKVVAKVLADRFKYGESMEMVRNLFSEKVTIDNLEIKEKKKFTVDGSLVDGNNLSEIESVVADINRDLVEGFESAKISGLSVDAVKGWTFDLEVNLK